MSLRMIPPKTPHHSFPRVSGDEPPVTLTLELDDLFSPRERG